MLTCSFYLLRNIKKKIDFKTFTTGNITSFSTDVLIIGGGAIGSSSAYWLKEKAATLNKNLHVLVVEKDPTVNKPY